MTSNNTPAPVEDAAEVDPFVDPSHAPRHILVIRENGDYGTEHAPFSKYTGRSCRELQLALASFVVHVDHGDNMAMHLREPGRYWVSVDPVDGNLEIGSRIS